MQLVADAQKTAERQQGVEDLAGNLVDRQVVDMADPLAGLAMIRSWWCVEASISISSSVADCVGRRRIDLAAGLGAGLAAPGAGQAMGMLVGVTLAFVGAEVAGLDAGGQQVRQRRRSHLGEPRGDAAGGEADVGAVLVEPDAAAQQVDHRLAQAGVGAGRAGLGAIETGLGAAFKQFGAVFGARGVVR